jgi:hypothetical protein
MRHRSGLVAVALTALGLAGCAVRGPEMPKDAAGLTQEQVHAMTLHEEFDRYRDRYDHLQRLLAGAQLAVHGGEWHWNGGDDIPQIGGDGMAPLPGADTHNTYALTSSRSYDPEGAEGAKSDLDPMLDYFAANNWSSHVERVGPTYYLDGFTSDGWRVEYLVQRSGHYSLTVYSDLFWTNDDDALSEAVGSRAAGLHPRSSRPGEYPDPPTWDSPIISPPKI